MKGACQAIRAAYNDELEKLLLTRDTHDVDVLAVRFCGNNLKEESITRACYNLDINNFMTLHGEDYSKYKLERMDKSLLLTDEEKIRVEKHAQL